MSRKLVLLAFLSLFVITVLVSQTTSSQSLCNKQCLIPQSGTVYYPNVSVDLTLAETVHNNDTGLNYTTIQAAIDAVETLDGHTILVDAGTYYENVVVNKSISLTGQNTSTTIIYGDGTGTAVTIIKSNVNVTGFMIQNNGIYAEEGIYLNNANHCIITGNNITNNNYYGVYLSRSSGNTVSGNHITNNNYFGVYLSRSSGNTVSGNHITNNDHGVVFIRSSNNNTVSGNHITNNNYFGVVLSRSSGNTVSGNHITNNNLCGVDLWYSSNNMVSGNTFINNGLYVEGSYGNVVEDNTVNGKPLVYLEEVQNYTIDYAGQVILVNCNNITIQNLNLSNTDAGVHLWNTNNCSISGNNITNNNLCGVLLYYSSNNNISGNNITANNESGILLASSNNNITGNNIENNYCGILLASSNNSIYHNNFVDNAFQVNIIGDSVNVWDDGFPSGGNYWSNYTGFDSDHDGIGDTLHVIDANNNDSCPLMGMFHSFNTSLRKHVNVISNSTLENFEYSEANSTIRMYVSYESPLEIITFGFCRACIPHELMNVTSISVIIDDGATTTLHPNYTLYDNGTHRWIYFAYQHSTHKIDIIPEFPSLILLPLFIIATLLAAMIHRRKRTCQGFKEKRGVAGEVSAQYVYAH